MAQTRFLPLCCPDINSINVHLYGDDDKHFGPGMNLRVCVAHTRFLILCCPDITSINVHLCVDDESDFVGAKASFDTKFLGAAVVVQPDN